MSDQLIAHYKGGMGTASYDEHYDNASTPSKAGTLVTGSPLFVGHTSSEGGSARSGTIARGLGGSELIPLWMLSRKSLG